MIRNYIGEDYKGTGLPKLQVETYLVYKAYSPWSYSHHSHITSFKGRYYVMFSNGWIDEDDVGQRVMLSTSDDFRTWTRPAPLVDTRMGEHFGLTFTAGGWHVYRDTLVAYVGEYEYDLPPGSRKPDHIQETPHKNTKTWAMTTTDGCRWSEPIHIMDRFVPNHGPQATRSGRLIMPGGMMYPYTDDPSGLSGWTAAGIYPRHTPTPYVDDSVGFRAAAPYFETPHPVLNEGSFIQTDDGVLHMFLRSGTTFLWHTTSADDGETWSPPEPTAFTDSVAKFHFGRLPDGRFYYVGNPSTQREYRTLLVLSLSTDGEDWTHSYILRNEETAPVFEGIYKDHGYQYPHTMVLGDYLHVVYSINKEDVGVLRTRLDGLPCF
ncbi:MAG: exo-alpha-sialidase [Anaerolineae bacterium]|nr:exo-alpha-sialidase [Anaerolineae bacterium]